MNAFWPLNCAKYKANNLIVSGITILNCDTRSASPTFLYPAIKFNIVDISFCFTEHKLSLTPRAYRDDLNAYTLNNNLCFKLASKSCKIVTSEQVLNFKLTFRLMNRL